MVVVFAENVDVALLDVIGYAVEIEVEEGIDMFESGRAGIACDVASFKIDVGIDPLIEKGIDGPFPGMFCHVASVIAFHGCGIVDGLS